MAIEINVQNALDNSAEEEPPSISAITRWAKAALEKHCQAGELTIRIVGAREGAKLNHTYRHIDGPTNVLSFPCDADADIQPRLLGDVVICAPVVESQAHEQGKECGAHWAHMVVHGVLHLLGYDHQDTPGAEEMEQIEKQILARLGFPNPYAPQQSQFDTKVEEL